MKSFIACKLPSGQPVLASITDVYIDFFTSALSTTYKRFNERNPKDTNITSSDTLDKITYSSRETG